MKEKKIIGSILSKGYAKGPLFFYEGKKDHQNIELIENDGVASFNQAVLRVKHDLETLLNSSEERLSLEEEEIYQSQLLMIQDPFFESFFSTRLAAGDSVEKALFALMNRLNQQAFTTRDSYFGERLSDFSDLIHLLLQYMTSKNASLLQEVETASILVCKKPSAFLFAEIDPKYILGVISTQGSNTSHAAILARAKGIPYLSNVDISLLEPAEVLLDGEQGHVIQYPNKMNLARFTHAEKSFRQEVERLSSLSKLHSVTYDGKEIVLMANIDFEEEVSFIEAYGAKGIGLFRSEYLYCKKLIFPSEEEQFHLFTRIIKRVKGAPFTLRTFDMAQDKLQSSAAEELYAFERKTFRQQVVDNSSGRKQVIGQIKALLRAALLGEARILFPMIVDLSDIREAKRLIEEAKNELSIDEKPYSSSVKVGAMIEVPAIAVTADLIMKEVDFVAMGTNDLIHYSFAEDRHFSKDGNFSIPPALFRLLRTVIAEADARGVEVSLCGEMASSCKVLPLLIGLGITHFSMAPRAIPIVKEQVRRLSYIECRTLAKEAAALETEEEITAALYGFHLKDSL